jgi:hypothetical protein
MRASHFGDGMGPSSGPEGIEPWQDRQMLSLKRSFGRQPLAVLLMALAHPG